MSSPSNRWSAVYALTLCVFTLIASEFLPTSLLTPMAHGLHLSSGQAGELIALSGVLAVVTSLCAASLTATLNRRTLVLWLVGVMILSGLFVSWAPTLLVVMLGRALIGVVVGGFWSISAAIVMRLVEEHTVPRALSCLNAGNALATTIAAPLGSFLGGFIGWRGAFFMVVPLGILTFLWLYVTLPSLPTRQKIRFSAPFTILKRPVVAWGFGAIGLLFIGQFSLMTYLRPFLEQVTQVPLTTLSLLLLLLGVAGVVGVWIGARVFERALTPSLLSIPALMALLAIGFILLGHSLPIVTLLVALWGMIGTAAPAAWWSWLSRTLPNDAEAGGGLMVAIIQFAIAAGSSGGGLLLDWGGLTTTFSASALCLIGSALAGWMMAHKQRGTLE